MSVWYGYKASEFIRAIEKLISKDSKEPERKVDRFLIFVKDTDGVYHAFGSHESHDNKEFIKEVMGE